MLDVPWLVATSARSEASHGLAAPMAQQSTSSRAVPEPWLYVRVPRVRAESRIPGTPTGPDQRPLAVCDEHQPGACTPGRCMLTAAAGAPTAYRISVLRPRSCCLPGRSDTLAGRHRMGTLHLTATTSDD